MKVWKVKKDQYQDIIGQMDYGLIYRMSEVGLYPAGEISLAMLDQECLEARIFSALGELHLIRQDQELAGYLVVDEGADFGLDGDEICNGLEIDEKQDILEKKYQLMKSFTSRVPNKAYLLTKSYIAYDLDDGQAYIYKTRLSGLEG